MASVHVCILQTSFAKRDDTVAFLKEQVPGVRVEFITDSTLLTDVRANGGPSQAVIDRMTLYAKAAEISGADLIVNSCSTVGEVADIYAKEVNVPVMKIDLPMAQEAVRPGDHPGPQPAADREGGRGAGQEDGVHPVPPEPCLGCSPGRPPRGAQPHPDGEHPGAGQNGL